jgi:hypothetical protein
MERKRPGMIDFAGPLWESLERWNTAQQAVGQQAKALFDAWVKARSADLEKGMAFYTSMASCRDPAAMLHLQQQWLLDAANRLQAEFQDLGGKVAQLAKSADPGAPSPTPAKRKAAE